MSEKDNNELGRVPYAERLRTAAIARDARIDDYERDNASLREALGRVVKILGGHDVDGPSDMIGRCGYALGTACAALVTEVATVSSSCDHLFRGALCPVCGDARSARPSTITTTRAALERALRDAIGFGAGRSGRTLEWEASELEAKSATAYVASVIAALDAHQSLIEPSGELVRMGIYQSDSHGWTGETSGDDNGPPDFFVTFRVPKPQPPAVVEGKSDE